MLSIKIVLVSMVLMFRDIVRIMPCVYVVGQVFLGEVEDIEELA